MPDRPRLRPTPANSGWRIDRRTFLKALGLSGAGLAAGASLGTWPRALLAAEAPTLGPIDELALALEFDTERIFRFVSERIRYEPYSGVLRGAEGTLMARAGNSADQAVLLAALLRASGIDCRFAQGALDAASADALLASGVTDVATTQQEFAEAITGDAEGGRPIVAPEPDAATKARVDDIVAQADRVMAWASVQIDETTALIGAALADAGIILSSGFSPLPDPERQGHLWVQAVSGPAWLDLDPSLPGSLPGEAAAIPTFIHEQVPDELRHRLTFAVVGETVAGGGLRQETLLEVDEFADTLAGVPIGVLNVEREGIKAIGANITAGLGGGTTYLPCLVVGEHVVVGPGALRFGGDPASDPFGGLAAETPGPAEGEPTAEWVRLTIHSPGAEPIVVQREIFDRLGPAARVGGVPDLASLPPAELVALEPNVPLDYLPAQRIHWLAVNPGPLGGDALGQALMGSEIEENLIKPPLGQYIAQGSIGLAVGLPRGVRTFTDGPNVSALTVDLDFDRQGNLTILPGLDIWHRSLGATRVDGTEATAPPALLAGVVPHLAERAIFGDALLESPEGAEIVSVGHVFDEARRAGIPITLLDDADSVEALPFPADTRARLRGSIASGWVAIVPERPVAIRGAERVGWWLVDPRSGRVVDELDTGRGASAVENSAVQTPSVRAAPAFNRMSACILFVAMMSQSLLTAAIGGAIAGTGVSRGSVALYAVGATASVSGIVVGSGAVWLAALNCG